MTEWTTARMRHDARTCFTAALAAIEPARCLRRALRREAGRLVGEGWATPLPDDRPLVVVAAGKAAAALAGQGARLLGGHRSLRALLVVPDDGAEVEVPQGWELRRAGHPLPDAGGAQAADRALALAGALGADGLLLLLLSGGASALLPAPAAGLTLADKQRTTALLLTAGAPIDELNAVRRHLSRLKGGQLAAAAYPAETVALLLSDVVGDDPAVIASGPASPDPTTYAQAWSVLQRRDLLRRVPPAVRARLARGLAGDCAETPKPGDPRLARARTVILGNNRLARQAAASAARALGYEVVEAADPTGGAALGGEARQAGQELAEQLLTLAEERDRAGSPVCLLAGGETTVTVRGRGRGGRNQELALAAARTLAGRSGLVLLAAGTDGRDGPTPAAGALVDGGSCERARVAGFSPEGALADNDSYPLLQASGDLLLTGPTGTNVADLVIGLAGR